VFFAPELIISVGRIVSIQVPQNVSFLARTILSTAGLFVACIGFILQVGNRFRYPQDW